MSDQTSNDRAQANMRDEKSTNLNNDGGKGQRACGPKQVKKENVTVTTTRGHPYADK
jgi:hypothetical protein